MDAAASSIKADDIENVPLRRLSGDSDGSDASDKSRLLEDEVDFEGIAVDEKLPPADGGYQAWRFLGGAWLIEAMMWGFPLTFGIFQAHYSNHELFAANSKSIPSIGALCVGFPYLLCPFMVPICLRWPKYQMHMLILGHCVCVGSLILASFATKVWHLMLTQGVLYGVGWVICYTPFLILLNQWWIKRRGLAYGIIYGASGITGLILPFILDALLARFGFRITLRTYAIAAVVLSGPGILLIKPRIPPSMLASQSVKERAYNDTDMKKKDPSMLRNPLFHLHNLATLLQGLAFFFPPTFLPSFSSALSLPSSTGDILLAINALAQVSGQLTLGFASDIISPSIPPTMSAAITGLAVFLLWGPAKGMLFLSLFSALWGFFAGSYSVLWTQIAAELAVGRSDKEAMTMYIYGVFSFLRGIASILEGPLSALMLGEEVQKNGFGLRKWRGIVVFTGVSLMLASVASMAAWVLARMTRKR